MTAPRWTKSADSDTALTYSVRKPCGSLVASGLTYEQACSIVREHNEAMRVWDGVADDCARGAK